MNGAATASISRAGSGEGRLAVLLLALLGFWTARLATGASGCFLDLVNLAFHEAGHLILAPFGATLHYLGGTLGQLAVPLVLAGYFLVARPSRPLGAACCVWWIGENLADISVYMADARDLALPLVGGGDHDWNELFYRFGLLGEDSVRAVSTTVHRAGVLFMLLGVAWIACFALPGRLRTRLLERLSGRAPVLRFLFEPIDE